MHYIGRFAPSPTGPLHAGSLVAALASWLDARAHGGRWLVRIEDVDAPRCLPGMGEHILAQLARLGLAPDAPPLWQSQRAATYQAALDQLIAQGLAYPCGCTRKDIEDALAASGVARGRGQELVYPGTCRAGLAGKAPRALRLHVERCMQKLAPRQMDTAKAATDSVATTVRWHDRALGPQAQDVAHEVGDFVLRRADGLWAYQLAVVVDDAHQQVSHVVRGQDLADNTPRQRLLQQALGLPAPRYLHTPLVHGADGQKLSKQNGAQPLDLADPVAALRQAAAVLGLPSAGAQAEAPSPWLARAVDEWRQRWA